MRMKKGNNITLLKICLNLIEINTWELGSSRQVSIDKGKINILLEGITVSLERQLEKASEIDQQIHAYKRHNKIVNWQDVCIYIKKPINLLCQMVRFNWKLSVKARKEGRSKYCEMWHSLKQQIYMTFALLNYKNCCKLEESTKKETHQLEYFQIRFRGIWKNGDTREIYKQFKVKKQQVDIKNHDDQLYWKHGMVQIQEITTHTGREADYGQYMVWVHHSGRIRSSMMMKRQQRGKIEHILEWRGGGDWQMGYYLLYRKLEIE
ncbi:unnamed protein product (macronuclear) [Paramecium tetraurelia]|uniref:ubiquitinyl hydrolase 1 n=1 Tax=Paramecium tetraurelia TaxID=5888 RepID=A0BP08_PARTE|nr:uncharacterized protein GSPATT00030914001 [Paramecium tetraurelia]CAK60275.1 unnamed protein product [Paramecium tetraurelia]|eukprot:XP_001427673.1 hypothetical protein (macronuclear) [Paramecium tetraurelia strain d4-2]